MQSVWEQMRAADNAREEKLRAEEKARNEKIQYQRKLEETKKLQDLQYMQMKDNTLRRTIHELKPMK